MSVMGLSIRKACIKVEMWREAITSLSVTPIPTIFASVVYTQIRNLFPTKNLVVELSSLTLVYKSTKLTIHQANATTQCSVHTKKGAANQSGKTDKSTPKSPTIYTNTATLNIKRIPER
jgi:hypothetical protein